MSVIYGMLGLNEATDASIYVGRIGEDRVYDAVNRYYAMVEADVAGQVSAFVNPAPTTMWSEVMKLPGSGRLQRLGPKSEPGDVKAHGGYNVQYPLEDFGAKYGLDRVAEGYMTMEELDRHVRTVISMDAETVRYEILYALLHKGGRTFHDSIQSEDLTIKSLADGDADTYPPIMGQFVDLTGHDHYMVSGFVTSDIDDTNNPFPTIVDELEHHFGSPTGGSDIIVFMPHNAVKYVRDLKDFDEVSDRFVQPGTQTAVPLPAGFPRNIPSTAKIHGRVGGAWAVEWRYLPDDYWITVHGAEDQPLKRRVDPVETGLPSALTLVANNTAYPLRNAVYSHRFGIGTRMRLNGVVMQFKASGTYDIPAGYTE